MKRVTKIFKKQNSNAIVCVIICVCVLIETLFFAACSNQRMASFYCVVAWQDNTSTQALQFLVEGSGGAGVVFRDGKKTFVLHSAFVDESEAIQNFQILKNIFSQSRILRLDISKTKIKNHLCKKMYDMEFEFCKFLCKTCVAFEHGSVSVAKVIQQVLIYKQKFEEYENMFNGSREKICQTFYSNSLVVKNLIKSFYSTVVIKVNRIEILRKLTCQTILEFVNVCKNI